MRDEYKILLFFILIFLAVFSAYVLQPKIEGDSLLYLNSIQVLKTGVEPVGFLPMMILTTYLGLKLIMFLNLFTDSIALSWSLLNSLLYIVMGISFYALLKRMVGDAKTAFWGTLFLVTNYAALSFGLAYMMDIGGWAAYIASLYFSYRYLEDEKDRDRWLYISAATIGIGGLYKEYAFVAYVIIFGLILFKNWREWRKIILKTLTTLSLVLGPFLLMNIYTFLNFNGYTYLDWFLHNQHTYTYQNRFVEFIKSFGSIYNFGWPLFLAGLYILLKRTRVVLQTKEVDKNVLFIWLTIFSSFSVLLWPVVTRVLFITMPAIVMTSSLFINKIKDHTFIIVSVLLVYVFTSYLMDAFILDFVNLPF